MAAHVYHWKHGWIPLDHTAALAKAKGNHKKAAEMLSAATSPDSGIKTKHDVAKAALGLSSISDVGDRHNALRNVQDAATQLGAHDALGFLNTPEARASQEAFRVRNNAHVVARTAPTPSAADLTEAADKWKRDNPGKKLAGHEREVSAIADELWRSKRLQSENTGPTDAQAAAERERVRKSASHSSQMASLFPAKGTDQYGHPTSYLGHSVASSRATQGGASGVVHSMHNGTDRSGLDATSRATVFVPDVNQQAGKAQAKSMTPAELRAQNQGDFRAGEEVAVKVAGGTRIATIREVAPDGRLVLHIPGHGNATRSAEDLSRQISTATRAAEDRRINGDWRKTPTSRLRMALHSAMFHAGQKAAIQAELTRRGD